MLVKVCAGRGFDQRRDTALILFLLDIGARLSEAANLEVSDLDWDLEVASVVAKGRRHRARPLSP
jgi:site-specific recombinase XerD